ncbi:dentin sialophosphoprotein-like [Littorina saxatilis]|uniref:Uncharacterized protein n=1 Tax=Littorina saxatilis TaxID=31220 RepID=A0AAN9AWZ1_9CAEN
MRTKKGGKRKHSAGAQPTETKRKRTRSAKSAQENEQGDEDRSPADFQQAQTSSNNTTDSAPASNTKETSCSQDTERSEGEHSLSTQDTQETANGHDAPTEKDNTEPTINTKETNTEENPTETSAKTKEDFDEDDKKDENKGSMNEVNDTVLLAVNHDADTNAPLGDSGPIEMEDPLSAKDTEAETKVIVSSDVVEKGPSEIEPERNFRPTPQQNEDTKEITAEAENTGDGASEDVRKIMITAEDSSSRGPENQAQEPSKESKNSISAVPESDHNVATDINQEKDSGNSNEEYKDQEFSKEPGIEPENSCSAIQETSQKVSAEINSDTQDKESGNNYDEEIEMLTKIENEQTFHAADPEINDEKEEAAAEDKDLMIEIKSPQPNQHSTEVEETPSSTVNEGRGKETNQEQDDNAKTNDTIPGPITTACKDTMETNLVNNDDTANGDTCKADLHNNDPDFKPDKNHEDTDNTTTDSAHLNCPENHTEESKSLKPNDTPNAQVDCDKVEAKLHVSTGRVELEQCDMQDDEQDNSAEDSAYLDESAFEMDVTESQLCAVSDDFLNEEEEQQLEEATEARRKEQEEADMVVTDVLQSLLSLNNLVTKTRQEMDTVRRRHDKLTGTFPRR